MNSADQDSGPKTWTGLDVTKENVADESEEIDKDARMRNSVINELINTERDYVKDIAYMLEELKEPLEEKNILDPPEMIAIFSNLSSLLGINMEVCSFAHSLIRAGLHLISLAVETI